MKKSLFLLTLSSSLLFASFAGFLSVDKKENIEEVSGYSSSSLPTTIDLNDSSESTIRSYYSSLNNLSTSERQGTNLLKNLKTILKNGQKYYSYENGTSIWQMYEITDRDWDKSPASSTTYGTYNANTNKITNYTYGTSSSSSKNNPYIHALYINRNVNNLTTAWDNHNQDQWGINREHVWPKAEGFDSSGAGGARGDPMHLMAGNGYANNIHSNYYYGYVKTSSSYTDCGSKYSNQSGNLRGTSKTLNSGTVFEPQDSDKGDIARAIFYMVARYNYLSGSDSDGIDTNNPNLTLTQNVSDWSQSGYTSSTSTTGKLGILTDLLAWHKADPVDEYEIHRNNLLYTNFTNNRNPFIDFPEWVDYIWGTATYSGTTYQSYSSTPTGYATPSGDTINGYNSSGSTVAVTGVSLDTNSATIGVDGTKQLVATVSPSNATNKAVTWTSSKTSVATVSSEGVVTGKSAGNTTITVRTSDGGYTATCAVTVKALSSISVSGQYKTEFNTGDTFTFGGTVTAHYSDSSTADVTDSVTFSGYNLSSAGNQTVTVSYGGKETTYSITVSAPEPGDDTTITTSIADYADEHSWSNGTQYSTVNLDSVITVTSDGGSNTGKYYTSGEEWRLYQSESATITIEAVSGYTIDSITITYNVANTGVLKDGNTEISSGTTVSNINSSSKTFSIGNTGSATNGQVKITSISVTYHSDSSAVTLESISLDTSECKLNYVVNEEFTYEDLVVTAHYSDGSSEEVVPDSVSSPNMSTTGNKTITVTYGGQTETYTITVSAATPTSITATVSKTFYVGETITKDDITVKDNLDNTITNYTFADYQFTYADAASGGALTNKQFNISAIGLQTTLTVQVQRKARVAPTNVKDTITATGLDGTDSYAAHSDKTFTSDAVYSAYFRKGDNSTIQMRTSYSNSGVVSTSSGGTIVSVKITVGSGSNTVEVYAKNTAYSSPSDLYSDSESTKGTLIGSTTSTNTITFTGSYTYFGVRSGGYAIYLSSIEVTYSGKETATTLSNYIMYEDTNSQCTTKFSVAKGYFEGMTTAERSTFMTSSDYVIATARERFEAWARNQGKTITSSNGDYVISNANMIGLSMIVGDTSNMILPILVSIISISSLAGLFYLKSKKKTK